MLLVWAAFLIAGVLIGTFFYALYLHSLGLVAGQSSAIFTRHSLFTSFFVAAEAMTFITGFCLISYRITEKGGVLQIIAFVLTQLLCWGILFPGVWFLEKDYRETHRAEIRMEKENSTLSKGYFRQAGSNVYYFMDDMEQSYKTDEKGLTAIKIDTEEEGLAEIIEIKYPGKTDVVTEAAPYKDILIKNTFYKTNIFNFIVELVEIGKRNCLRGWTYWLGFASLGFALASIIALSSISNWKVISFSVTGVLYFGVLFFNCIFWSPLLFKFRTMDFMHSGIFNIPSAYTSSPFLILVNLVFGLVVISVGLIHFFAERKKNK